MAKPGQTVRAIGRTERTSSARSGSMASSGMVTTSSVSPSALKRSRTHPLGPPEGGSTKSTIVATSPIRRACSGKERLRATRSKAELTRVLGAGVLLEVHCGQQTH